MNDYITTLPRESQERRGKIRTYTGKYVNPLSMRPDDIDIIDIAHHLSNECRYTGACPEFYSVAQHCVLASKYFDTPQMQLAGLLHDASEAYLRDLPSPVKHDPRMTFYREVEHELTVMIFARFGLNPGLEPLTKGADNDMFKREVATWWGGNYVPIDIVPWAPAHAREEFLVAFHLYNEQLENGL